MLAQIETLKSLDWTQDKMLDQARVYEAKLQKEREYRKIEKDKLKGETQKMKVESMRDKLRIAFGKRVEGENQKRV